MSLYTLNELHNKTLETIQSFIQHDYKIDPSVYSENKFIFTVKLFDKHSDASITIKTVQDDHKHTFTRQRQLIPTYESCASTLNLKNVYYLSYDDVYAESKEEAADARNKHYSNVFGLDTDALAKLLKSNTNKSGELI